MHSWSTREDKHDQRVMEITRNSGCMFMPIPSGMIRILIPLIFYVERAISTYTDLYMQIIMPFSSWYSSNRVIAFGYVSKSFTTSAQFLLKGHSPWFFHMIAIMYVKDALWFMSYFKYYIRGEWNLSNLESLLDFIWMHALFWLLNNESCWILMEIM